MARTLMARLLTLTRTRSCDPMIPYMGILWSNFCIYLFMLLFSFSVFSDRRLLKIENENNNTKTPTAESPYIGLGTLEFSLQIQSTLVISKSKGPSKTVRDIRTSTYQICSIEEKTI